MAKAKSSFLHHRLVVGYHACSRATRDAVLMNGDELKTSKNNYDWLGEGVYFWEHGPDRAEAFGKEMAKRKKKPLVDPVVLGGYIHLGRCLDLTDAAAPQLLADHYELLKEALLELPINEPAKDGTADILFRRLDCAVINFTIDTLNKQEPSLSFQTVRGAFTEGAAAYPGASIYAKTHIQIAVRDPTCILGYFLPR